MLTAINSMQARGADAGGYMPHAEMVSGLGQSKVIIISLPRGNHQGGIDGRAAATDARRGERYAREQRRIDGIVGEVQARFGALGIRSDEGNGPVDAIFLPRFPNAAYLPVGDTGMGIPRDSIVVGVDPRSGRSFAEADDVVAHELAHRVIDNMTKRPLSTDPASADVAIHESLADTLAAVVDDQDPWTLGEGLVSPIRLMDRPEVVGHPGHVDDLAAVMAPGSEHMVPIGRDRETGEIVRAPDWHVVAGIPNKAASIMGSKLGRETLGKIYVNAIRNYVEPGKSLPGLASAVLRSTSDIYGGNSPQMKVALDAWQAVGLIDIRKR